MSKLPEAAPIPDKPPIHIKGGNLVVASPTSITEACFSVPAVRASRTAESEEHDHRCPAHRLPS